MNKQGRGLARKGHGNAVIDYYNNLHFMPHTSDRIEQINTNFMWFFFSKNVM